MSAVTCMSRDHHMMVCVQGMVAEVRGNYIDAVERWVTVAVLTNVIM